MLRLLLLQRERRRPSSKEVAAEEEEEEMAERRNQIDAQTVDADQQFAEKQIVEFFVLKATKQSDVARIRLE